MEINTLNNFVCKICNKTYSSNSGLWKHNKNKHPNNNIVINQDTAKLQQNAAELMQNFQNLQQNAVKMYQKDFICKFCNFVHFYSEL